jgi:putative NIF3 family GTP cyclohydrolase 1 type 2
MEKQSVILNYLNKNLSKRDIQTYIFINQDDTVQTIAIGAGSGSKLLNNVKADMIITGEFDHHEILHETHRGVSLILTDHSNTERLYYKYFKAKFTELLQKNNESVEILISETDRDPLEYI